MQRQTRRWVLVSVVCAAVALLVGSALWLAPTVLLAGVGGNPASSGIVSVNGSSYASETHELFGTNVSSWDNYSFNGVYFSIHFWCGDVTPGGAELCGNATLPDGPGFNYSFWDGLPDTNPTWQTAMSPGGSAGAQYMQGGLFRLLVSTTLHPPS